MKKRFSIIKILLFILLATLILPIFPLFRPYVHTFSLVFVFSVLFVTSVVIWHYVRKEMLRTSFSKYTFLKVIILGYVINMLGSSINAFVSIIIVHINGKIIPNTLLETKILLNPDFVLLFNSIIIIFRIVAGYAASAVAKRSWVFYGALSSAGIFVGDIISLIHHWSGWDSMTSNLSMIQDGPLTFISPILGIMGGYIRVSHVRSVTKVVNDKTSPG